MLKKLKSKQWVNAKKIEKLFKKLKDLKSVNKNVEFVKRLAKTYYNRKCDIINHPKLENR